MRPVDKSEGCAPVPCCHTAADMQRLSARTLEILCTERLLDQTLKVGVAERNDRPKADAVAQNVAVRGTVHALWVCSSGQDGVHYGH